MASAASPDINPRWARWENRLDRAADVPWGLAALVVLAGFDMAGLINPSELEPYATAAGLFGLGHSIHTGAKHFRAR